jgi:hypothetical protein
LVALSLVLAGCGGSVGGTQGTEDTSSGVPGERGVTSGRTAADIVDAEVRLEPVDDSGVSGSAIFTQMPERVEVGLQVSGLPEPEASYRAHLHAGTCGEKQKDSGHGHEYRGHNQDVTSGRQADGISMLVVRFSHTVSENPEYAHGEQEHGHGAPNGGLPGEMDHPIMIASSADGTASIITTLEGVRIGRLLSGSPKRLEVHASSSIDSPVLACGNLGAVR